MQVASYFSHCIVFAAFMEIPNFPVGSTWSTARRECIGSVDISVKTNPQCTSLCSHAFGNVSAATANCTSL